MLVSPFILLAYQVLVRYFIYGVWRAQQLSVCHRCPSRLEDTSEHLFVDVHWQLYNK